MHTISICVLIFVISSDYAYGKLGSRRKKVYSSDESMTFIQNLRADSESVSKESGGDSKEAGGSKESGGNSREPSEESREYEGDSKGGKSKETLEKLDVSESSSTEEDSTAATDPRAVTKQPKTPATPWKKGTVPYRIDRKSYDKIIIRRIREAMRAIEAVSCVIFKNMSRESVRGVGVWLHITNPDNERDCVHEPRIGSRGEAVMVLGFDCMQKQDITHALLHALGFKDEVTHPQRDSYVRVLWENIQPKYHPLFAIQSEPSPFQLVEYDTMSVMHFHDRAFSSNGGATVTPLISGLVINPSEGLSQLDIMKLRLAFGHECNKRKVDNLLETCKSSLLAGAAGKVSESQESGSADSASKKTKKTKNKEHGSEASDEEIDQGSDNDGKNAENSELNAIDNGSDGVSIIDITTTRRSTKPIKPTHPNNSKQELAGSKFGGMPPNKRGRGRKTKTMLKKNKKQTKTRQSKRQKQVKTKRNSKKNQTRKRSSRKRQ